MPNDATFGARLALIRQHMQWGNVQEAALACGLPVASWRNWERDGRLPRDLIAISGKIAQATGCDQAWLAGLPQPSTGTSLLTWNLIGAGDGPVDTGELVAA